MSALANTANAFRAALLANDLETAGRLTDAYLAIYARISTQLTELLNQIDEARERGEVVNLSWLYQQARYQQLLDDLMVEIARFAETTGRTIQQQKAVAVEVAQDYARQMMLDGLGPGPEMARAQVAAMLVPRLPTKVVEEVVGNLTPRSPLAKLLNEFGPQAARRVKDALVVGVGAGLGAREIAGLVQKASGMTLDRALTISRTETLRAAREATHRQFEQNDSVVGGWIWHAQLNGTRTCLSCITMHGTWHSLDERLDDHINGRCLPAGVLAHGPAPVAATTRHYAGDLVTIRTASGNELSFTPNHPILTPHGWIAGGLLVEGDYVISSAERQGAASTVDEDDYHMPSRIEEIAESFGVIAAEMPGTSEDFHGDGINGEIYVVRTNRLLWNRLQAAFNKPLLHQDFSGRSVGGTFLTGPCSLNPLVEQLNPSTSGGLRSRDSLSMLFGSERLREKSIGLRVCSQCHPVQLESPSDDRTSDTEGLSERVLGFASEITPGNLGFGQDSLRPLPNTNLFPDYLIAQGAIAKQAALLEDIGQALLAGVKAPSRTLAALAIDIRLDRVVQVFVRRWSGQVYNLQTVAGWYIANNIITHNCTAIPVTKTWEELLGPAFADVPDSRPTVETGIEWFESLTRSKQRALIERHAGKAAGRAFLEGRVTLTDFVARRESKQWGSMRQQATVAQALSRGKYTSVLPSAAFRRVGQVLTFPEDDNQPVVVSARESFKTAIAAVEGIHRIDDLPTLPIQLIDLGDVEGNFVVDDQTKKPLSIEIRSKSRDKETVLLHEFAHYIDYAIFGTNRQYGSTLEFATPGSTDLTSWLAAVTTTKAFDKLIEILRNPGRYPWAPREETLYLLYPAEMFARSYAQFIAKASEKWTLTSQIDRERRLNPYPYFWGDDDFRTVEAAFRQLIEKRKWAPISTR